MYQKTLNFTCYSDESNLPVVTVTPKLIHCVSGIGEIARSYPRQAGCEKYKELLCSGLFTLILRVGG